MRHWWGFGFRCHTEWFYLCVGSIHAIAGGDGVSSVFLAPTESWEKTDLVLVAVQGAPSPISASIFVVVSVHVTLCRRLPH